MKTEYFTVAGVKFMRQDDNVRSLDKDYPMSFKHNGGPTAVIVHRLWCRIEEGDGSLKSVTSIIKHRRRMAAKAELADTLAAEAKADAKYGVRIKADERMSRKSARMEKMCRE